jgi:hypothetical protein
MDKTSAKNVIHGHIDVELMKARDHIARAIRLRGNEADDLTLLLCMTESYLDPVDRLLAMNDES